MLIIFTGNLRDVERQIEIYRGFKPPNGLVNFEGTEIVKY